MDLHAERYDVRQSAKRNTYTGKTYNSLDNISQFFGERGMPFKPAQAAAAEAGFADAAAVSAAHRQPSAAAGSSAAQPAARKGARTGMVVEHPKYGTGTVVRREGEGDDAKITVNFPRYGLKKLIEKYAGLKRN